MSQTLEVSKEKIEYVVLRIVKGSTSQERIPLAFQETYTINKESGPLRRGIKRRNPLTPFFD